MNAGFQIIRGCLLGARDSTGGSMGSPFAPVSPEGHAQLGLIWYVLGIAFFFALLIIGLVTWVLIRYRQRPGRAPSTVEGNKLIEVTYTVAPLAVMISLFVYTVITMRRAEPASDPPSDGRRPDLIITAHQWWWELQYPKSGVKTANEIHLPAGRPMLAELKSADVIHELWVPRMGPKMDAVPGHPNYLLIQSDKTGVLLGNCAEFCGPGHAWMRLRVEVQPSEAFAEWQRRQLTKPSLVEGDAAEGRQYFLAHTCAQCHTIAGTSAAGLVGPDLTHFASRATLAAGTLENTPANVRRWLADPQQVKPGCYMPRMQLSGDEIAQLTAFLESLK